MHGRRVENVQDDRPKLAQKFAHPPSEFSDWCARVDAKAELERTNVNPLFAMGTSHSTSDISSGQIVTSSVLVLSALRLPQARGLGTVSQRVVNYRASSVKATLAARAICHLLQPPASASENSGSRQLTW